MSDQKTSAEKPAETTAPAEPQGLTVKFNKKEIKLSPEEAANYAQRGMKMEQEAAKLASERERLSSEFREKEELLKRAESVFPWLDGNPRIGAAFDAVAKTGSLEAVRQFIEDNEDDGATTPRVPAKSGPTQADIELQRKLDLMLAKQAEIEAKMTQTESRNSLEAAFKADAFLRNAPENVQAIARDLIDGYVSKGSTHTEATTLASHSVKEIAAKQIQAELDERRRTREHAEVPPGEGTFELPDFKAPEMTEGMSRKQWKRERRKSFTRQLLDGLESTQRGPS